MTTVPTWRLHLLRAAYLLLVVGLGVQVWPKMISGISTMTLGGGTVTAMLWTMSVLAIVGLRYPLQMLPLLFFETIWKAAWLLTVALPHWTAGTMDHRMAESAFACIMGAIFPIVIPWDYVFDNYVRKTGDRWWNRARS
ncbi:MAG TPA: hypothetical protein VJ750_09105 [Rhizomicrobium sp.]|nr:hypothetical protein [Rhizomicrobium sp.]